MANEIRVDHASGNTLYAVIRNAAGQPWQPVGQTFADWGAGGCTVADYAIPLTYKSGSRYVGNFDTNIPAGGYGIQVFQQAGANPADTDALVYSRDIVWTGTGELTSAKLLANKSVQDRMTLAVTYYDDDGQTVLLTHTVDNAATTFTKTPG